MLPPPACAYPQPSGSAVACLCPSTRRTAGAGAGAGGTAPPRSAARAGPARSAALSPARVVAHSTCLRDDRMTSGPPFPAAPRGGGPRSLSKPPVDGQLIAVFEHDVFGVPVVVDVPADILRVE